MWVAPAKWAASEAAPVCASAWNPNRFRWTLWGPVNSQSELYLSDVKFMFAEVFENCIYDYIYIWCHVYWLIWCIESYIWPCPMDVKWYHFLGHWLINLFRAHATNPGPAIPTDWTTWCLCHSCSILFPAVGARSTAWNDDKTCISARTETIISNKCWNTWQLQPTRAS